MIPILIIAGTIFVFLGILLLAFILSDIEFIKGLYKNEDRITAILFTILYGALLVLSPESIYVGVRFVLKGLGY